MMSFLVREAPDSIKLSHDEILTILNLFSFCFNCICFFDPSEIVSQNHSTFVFIDESDHKSLLSKLNCNLNFS